MQFSSLSFHTPSAITYKFAPRQNYYISNNPNLTRIPNQETTSDVGRSLLHSFVIVDGDVKTILTSKEVGIRGACPGIEAMS